MKFIQYHNWDKINKRRFLENPRMYLDEFAMWKDLTGKSLSLFGNFFYAAWDKHFFCFRFFGGYGLKGNSDKKRCWVPFSERMGLTKTYKLFGWTFKILKPFK